MTRAVLVVALLAAVAAALSALLAAAALFAAVTLAVVTVVAVTVAPAAAVLRMTMWRAERVWARTMERELRLGYLQVMSDEHSIHEPEHNGGVQVQKHFTTTCQTLLCSATKNARRQEQTHQPPHSPSKHFSIRAPMLTHG